MPDALLMLECKIFIETDLHVGDHFGSKLCFDGSLTLAQAEHLQVRQTAEGFKVMSFLTTREI